MQTNGDKWVLPPPLFPHFNSLYFPGRHFKDFLKVRGASVEANPLSLNTQGKEAQKGPRTGGEDCVPRNEDDTIEMTGEKEKDETVERFYPTYSQFLATVYTSIKHLKSYPEQILAFSLQRDCRIRASISNTVILPQILDWKAWSDLFAVLVIKASVPSPEDW